MIESVEGSAGRDAATGWNLVEFSRCSAGLNVEKRSSAASELVAQQRGMIGKPLSLDDQEVSSIFAGLLGRASLADQLLRSHLNGPFFIILLNHDLVRFIVEFEFADIAQGIRESMIPTGSVLGQFLGPAVGIAEPTLQAARTFERRMPSRDGDAGA